MRLPKPSAIFWYGTWVCVLLTSPATAATYLATPPFFVEEGESVECAIVYLGRKEITAEPQVRKSGAVVESSGQNLLSSGQVATVDYDVPSDDQYWCQFSGRLKTRDVRASGQVRDSGGAIRLIVPAQ